MQGQTWQCSIHSSSELSSRRTRGRMEQYSGIIKDIIVLPLYYVTESVYDSVLGEYA